MHHPCTGGCYDGLEEFNVNLNQGAESTVTYLMARLTLEKFLQSKALQPATSPSDEIKKLAEPVY